MAKDKFKTNPFTIEWTEKLRQKTIKERILNKVIERSTETLNKIKKLEIGDTVNFNIKINIEE